eukprot:427313-Hanusia_phi.AAC.1
MAMAAESDTDRCSIAPAGSEVLGGGLSFSSIASKPNRRSQQIPTGFLSSISGTWGIRGALRCRVMESRVRRK